MTAKSLEQVVAEASAVIYHVQHNNEFMLNFFIPEEMKFRMPWVHGEILDLMKFKFLGETALRSNKLVIAIPRGHAKTTLAKIATVWYMLFSSARFFVYVGATLERARDAVSDIMEYMDTDNFKATFGAVEVLRQSTNIGFYVFVVSVNGVRRRIILRAIGAGQKMRGINYNNRRPQVAVVDDLEDYEEIGSKIQSATLRKWVFGTFLKAMDQVQHWVIWLGNMLDNDSLLFRLTKDPDWFSRVYGAILENGEPLWPDLWSIEALVADLHSYKLNKEEHTWMAEMMNSPVPAGGGLLDFRKVQYRHTYNPAETRFVFMTIDPAISKKTYANKSALVVHGFHNNAWMPVDYIHMHLNPIEMFHAMVHLAVTWGVSVIGIEAVAYQSALQHIYPYMLQQKAITGIEIVPLTAWGKKTERLKGWGAVIEDGQYVLPVADVAIMKQLLAYDVLKEENDDDLIDACAYGPQMITRYMPKIMNKNLRDMKIGNAPLRVGVQTGGII